MNILIVYDSVCRSTECVAQFIADRLEQNASVITMPVEKAGPLPMGKTVDLLVIGAISQFQTVTPAMTEWLDRIAPRALRNIPVAIFDTRLRRQHPLCGGSIFWIERVLDRVGATQVVPPQSFFAADTEGMLEACEMEQASAWADVLLWKMQPQMV